MPIHAAGRILKLHSSDLRTYTHTQKPISKWHMDPSSFILQLTPNQNILNLSLFGMGRRNYLLIGLCQIFPWFTVSAENNHLKE